MQAHAGFSKIVTDESLRETVRHGSEEYPLQSYLEDIWLFDFHCVDWHWHPEVELVLVQTGRAEFLIGSGRYTLEAGSGVFINSQVLHRFEAAESTVIPNIVFSPTLLSPEGSLVYQKYIHPVLVSPAECLVLPPGHPALALFSALFAAQEAEGARELKTVELLLRLWDLLYQYTGAATASCVPQASPRAQARLQIMMQYIHKNYASPISLDDIAKTVSLSKSSVRNLFCHTIHTSPINYLVQYRLKQAAKLLSATESSVSSIAQDTGFENIGYFCRKFKEAFCLTPSEYRKRRRERRRSDSHVSSMDRKPAAGHQPVGGHAVGLSGSGQR